MAEASPPAEQIGALVHGREDQMATMQLASDTEIDKGHIRVGELIDTMGPARSNLVQYHFCSLF